MPRTIASIVDGRPREDAPGGRLTSTNPARTDEVVAEVLVDAVQADWAAAAVGEAAIAERRPDGSVVIKLTVTNAGALRSFVLGFLDHAEVLGPPALRRDMVDWLAGLAEVQPEATVGTGQAAGAAEERG